MLTPELSQTINWTNVGVRAAGILLTWLIVGFLVRNIGRWFDRLFERARKGGQAVDRREWRSADTLINALLITVGVIVTLAILELTPLLMSMLTAAGVAGIITGFAVKDVAANLISGIFLLIDRPFSVGDFVSAGNIQGTIDQIALRTTRIRTLDGPVVTIPNSLVAAGAITNYSVNPNRRFEIVLTLPLDADPDRATRLLLDLAAAEPRLFGNAPQVFVGETRAFAFDLKLICEAPNGVWLQTQSDMKRAMLAQARGLGLLEALPAQVVYTTALAPGSGDPRRASDVRQMPAAQEKKHD